MQDLWSTLVQNPQLLNTAASMGLLQNPNPGLQTMPSNPNQALLGNMLANLGGSQQGQQHGVQYPGKMDLDMETVSESIISDVPIQSPVQIEQSHLPFPQSKRYKRGSMDRNGQFVRDKRKTCFVGHLPPNATKADLAQHFSQAGEVVHVVRRPNEGVDATWAFVQYRTQAERDHAIQILDRTAFGEQTLVVKPAKDELDFDPNEPVNECWFCLGSPSSDKALIVSVGNESYLAVDKGPISDEHVLIIPTNHYPNTLRMSESCYNEMQLYLIGLREMFACQGRFLLAFERYLQIPRLHGNHTHLSVISIDEEAASNAKETFLQRGRMQEGEWAFLNPNEATREAVHDIVGDEEYIVVILPDGSKLVRAMFKKNRLPVSFGRDVMAELAGIPERADWKLCLSSESEEKLKVDRFKTQFTAFDYPNKS